MFLEQSSSLSTAANDTVNKVNNAMLCVQSSINEFNVKGGEVVAVVGDGDNDASALECADFGFAVGSGTKTVWKAAQVVLTDNDLRNVAATFKLSRACVETIKKNLRIVCICNLVLLPFALGIAALFGGPLLQPWMLLAVTVAAAALTAHNTWKLKIMKLADRRNDSFPG